MTDGVIRGHEEILAHTAAFFRSFPIPEGIELKLPPPSTMEMDIRFEEYVPNQSLTAIVTVPAKYANAVGLMQGGFLAAMFDNLIGPLSYLAARAPTTSLDLTTQFLRPVFPGENLRFSAVVRKAGRKAIFVAAEAFNSDRKLVATALSTIQVLSM